MRQDRHNTLLEIGSIDEKIRANRRRAVQLIDIMEQTRDEKAAIDNYYSDLVKERAALSKNL